MCKQNTFGASAEWEHDLTARNSRSECTSSTTYQGSNTFLMEVSSFRNVFNLCHLSLYWCAQTFPLPWHTSCSLLHAQETLQMSIWFRTGKHNICSNNSAGKSVNCLATLSEITAFVPKTRSPVFGVAIFSVYSDDIIEAPPSWQRKHAPLWCKGLNHIL